MKLRFSAEATSAVKAKTRRVGQGAVARAGGRLRRLATLLLMLLFATPALAAPDAAGHRQSLSQCVARQLAGDTAATMFASPARYDCKTPTVRHGPGNFWLLLHTPAPSALHTLSLMPQWQRDATLYARHTDGSIAARALDNRTLWNLMHLGARIQLPVPGDSAPVTALLLRIDGAVNQTGLIDAPMLLDLEAATARERFETAIYGFFAGLAIALFAYNLVLWLTIHERFQLTYCLTLLSMLLYDGAHSGAICLAWGDGDFTTALKLNYITMAAVGMLAPRFFIDFLEPGMVSRGLQRVAFVCMGLMTTICLAIATAPLAWLHWLDRTYVMAFLPVPVLAVAIVTGAVRRGSKAVAVMALAWSMPLVMVVVRLLHALNLIGFNALIEHSPVLAMGLEALFGSLAMASRIKRIARERDTARAEERLARRLADVDPLTGLLNRRALLDRLLSWQSCEPLRLCIIDVDHFKAVNDAHGHDLGDAVLRELAAVLGARVALRASIGRMGGEEFALVGTAAELSPAVALAILSDVRAHHFPGDLRITVSIGMAEGLVANDEDWLALYRRADAALYAAKAGGRNRATQSEIARTAAQAGDAAVADAA